MDVSEKKSRGLRTNRCPGCNLPHENCVCGHLIPVPCNIRVCILRHHKEAHRSSGTAILALRGLQNSELLDPNTVNEFLQANSPEGMAMLFPPDGQDQLTNFPSTAEMFQQVKILIVPDGTWMQTRKMVRKNPLLKALPRVSPQMLTRWTENPLRLDKWERPCTAEAIGQWLGEAGETGAASHLRHCLQVFVEAHWKARGGMIRLMRADRFTDDSIDLEDQNSVTN
jgi:DTW domain-containing protein YfiP